MKLKWFHQFTFQQKKYIVYVVDVLSSLLPICSIFFLQINICDFSQFNKEITSYLLLNSKADFPFYKVYFLTFGSRFSPSKRHTTTLATHVYVYTNISISISISMHARMHVYQYDKTQKLNVQTRIINSLTECVSLSSKSSWLLLLYMRPRILCWLLSYFHNIYFNDMILCIDNIVVQCTYMYVCHAYG